MAFKYWIMTKDRLLELVIQRMDGGMNEEERLELEAWAAEEATNRKWLDRVMNEELFNKEIRQWSQVDPGAGYLRWRDSERAGRAGFRRIVGWMAAACILAVVVGVGFWRHHDLSKSTSVIATAPPTALPGRNTATLTLASGQQVLLDSAGVGQLAMQGNVKLTKVGSGSLAYSAANAKDNAIVYNLLTTPRSGTYQVILPDGTKVWLNNVSSLRYPTSFIGQSNRSVFLTGEGFFEVAKDPTKPFTVDVNGEKVTVLGTGFNIKAYADEESIQTTLVSGRVEVQAGNSKVQLHPDEQAQWKGSGEVTLIKGVDANEVASWKDGFFYFGKASLDEVMRQLARWYDVDVQYKGPVPNLEFAGKIDRTVDLETLLEFLKKNEVHFQLEGKTIVVLPS